MAANDYHFITSWRVESTCREITEVLTSGTELARWWPAVYLDVKLLERGDANGVGSVTDLYTKGWLPYTLLWKFRITETNHPHGFTLLAQGDFNGRGIWTFEQDGPFVIITYDWQIRADKPILRDYSFVMRPLFEANHRWAMWKGEESLKLELARRRAASDEQRALIPAPPPPTPSSPLPWLVDLGAVILVVGGLLYGLRRWLTD